MAVRSGDRSTADQTSNALEVENLTVRYGLTPALENVSLAIRPGRLVGVIGPNGAGKSTLFRAILGIAPIVSGRVRVLGEDIGRDRAEVAYVPQREDVDWRFPVTVGDVVLMGRYPRLGWFRRPGGEDRAIAAGALAQVGLAESRARQIGRLSGGQQQRVFIARALAQRARLLLLDEPLNAVDETSQHQILTLLREERDRGTTVLMSTHDLHRAADVCDELICLNRRLIAHGPPSAVFNARVLAETYAGHMLVVERTGDGLGLALDDGHHHGHSHDHGHGDGHAHDHEH